MLECCKSKYIHSYKLQIWCSVSTTNRKLGIILSGGPASVYLDGSPTIEKALYEQGIPVLGICYGMQLTSQLLGGTVERADKQEFGKAELIIDELESPLFKDVPNLNQVWMSHGDHVTVLPEGFKQIAHTDSCIAASANVEKNIYCIQYHAEVTHSEYGAKMLENFVFGVAKCEKNWSMGNYIEQTVKSIKETVGDKKVLLGLSGGVDSSVAAALIHKAIGDQLICIFVDTGLLRKDEAKNVMEIYGENFHMNIKCVDAEERFLSKLAGVTDPEAKRKIIGKEFVEVFNDEASKLTDVKFLAQGTIYPDVIESQSVKGPSATIKSHHNVGGLPEDMKFELLEPLRELFKDEVRAVGRELVGVMGDERTYEYTAVLRSANTIDFMTATWSRLPYEFLDKVSNRIINEVKGINRLTYDISSKPPATIEWE